MEKTESTSIRALIRGLDVLRAINADRSASLTSIAATVQLPHATVVRIVRTLEADGFVTRDGAGKTYRPTALTHTLSCGYNDEDHLVACARSPIEELTRDIGWPIAVLTRAGGQMIARDSTVAMTSLTFNVYQAGIALPIFGSAAGRAFFAFSGDDERAEMLRHAEQAGGNSSELMIQPFRSEETVTRIRAMGCATIAETRHPMNVRRNAAIAVPVFANDRIAGVICMVYFARAMRIDDAVSTFAGKLKDCAARIGAALDNRPVPLRRANAGHWRARG